MLKVLSLVCLIFVFNLKSNAEFHSISNDNIKSITDINRHYLKIIALYKRYINLTTSNNYHGNNHVSSTQKPTASPSLSPSTTSTTTKNDKTTMTKMKTSINI